jgi:hypothetical protein
MANQIRNVEIRIHRLTPFEAELWVVVVAETITSTTELRGKFVGPKSPTSSTIEVSYPLRPFTRKPSDLPDLCGRVIIPEPNVWKPETPLVYDATIELWHDGDRRGVHQILGYKLLTAGSTFSRSQ